MDDPIRIAVVGTGDVAMSHAAALTAPGPVAAEIVAAVDTDRTRLSTFLAEHRIPAGYHDIDELLVRSRPDLVYLCTPPGLHRDQTLACLRSGVSVLAEKPPAMSLRELDEIAAAASGPPWFATVFQHRFGEGQARLKALAGSGLLGRPLLAVCHTTWFRDQTYFDVPWRGRWDTEGGGPTMGHGIHQMDMLLDLLGDWSEVRAVTRTQARRTETEDVSLAHVTFASGAVASVVNSVVSPRQESYLRYDFEHATVEVTHLYGYRDEDWRVTPAPGHEDVLAAWQAGTAATASGAGEQGIRSGHQAQFARVLSCLRDGTPPPVALAESRRTLALVTAIYASAAAAAPVTPEDITPGTRFYDSMAGHRAEGAAPVKAPMAAPTAPATAPMTAPMVVPTAPTTAPVAGTSPQEPPAAGRVPLRAFGPQADPRFVETLAAAVDAHVGGLLGVDGRDTLQHRVLGARIKAFTTAYLTPRSRWFGDGTLLAAAQEQVKALTALQGGDGLFGGDNLASPPDSAFTVNDLCVTADLIGRAGRPELEGLETGLARILRPITPALLTGGVHTPNHRWEICAALARLHRLAPDPRLPARIDQWLAEGIDLQPDGMYSERSPLYASAVTNPSLLAVADVLGRPELLEPVRRNLAAFAGLFDEDGVVESVHSRRQDQRKRFDGAGFLAQYLRFAHSDRRPDYAAIAAGILARGIGGELAADVLATVLLDPSLADALPQPPAAGPAAPATTLLADSGLARVRSGRRAVTVYGGGDMHRHPHVGSGLATNPTFLRFRHGEAVLESVRLAADFFSLGPFRSAGLRVEEDRFLLASTSVARYYQPLPAELRQADGGYELGSEGRYFAAMDFARRPADEHRLRIEAEVVPVDAGVEVRLSLEGVPTSFALELAFRTGGVLSGVSSVPGAEVFELVSGTGAYTVGDSVIRFGPGNGSGLAQPPEIDPGELFTYLGADDTAPGTRVYVTGRVPGTYTLTLTGSDAD